MSAETFTSLVNLGAAGAVIIVVLIFLRYLAKREADWQSFFTALTTANEADIRRVTDAMEKISIGITVISSDLQRHDNKVEDRIQAIQIADRASAKRTANKNKAPSA